MYLSIVKRALVPIWQAVPIPFRRFIVWLSQPTFTVGVTGIVFNSRGEILLLRHRFRESGDWELPGGLLARGETLEAALQRELWEETRLDVEVVSLVGIRVATGRHMDVCFAVRAIAGSLRPDSDEIAEARFFSCGEAARFMPAEPTSLVNTARGILGFD